MPVLEIIVAADGGRLIVAIIPEKLPLASGWLRQEIMLYLAYDFSREENNP